jgi:hypothetical protein
MRERFPAVFDRINFIKKIGPYQTMDQKIEKHINKYFRMYIESRKNKGDKK